MTSDKVQAIQWTDDGLRLLDQRKLPGLVEYLLLENAGAVADAIRDMVVRGAPAIGITAAFGVVLSARACYARNPKNWKSAVRADLERLRVARPTAVNLGWALQRMGRVMAAIDGDPFPVLLQEAQRIHQEDVDANLEMGRLGAALIEEPCAVLTHCNTGSLATGGFGTALGVIRAAHAEGKIRAIYVDETRPWLQGSRLTAWELSQDGLPATVIVDSAAASTIRRRGIQWVIVGADRVAANGDVANKIGTYNVAIAARYHGARFMVVAPVSTVDPDTPSGEEIIVEDRDGREILDSAAGGVGGDAWNPVFDITPAELIDFLVTERGVVRNPDHEGIARLTNNVARM